MKKTSILACLGMRCQPVIAGLQQWWRKGLSIWTYQYSALPVGLSIFELRQAQVQRCRWRVRTLDYQTIEWWQHRTRWLGGKQSQCHDFAIRIPLRTLQGLKRIVGCQCRCGRAGTGSSSNGSCSKPRYGQSPDNLSILPFMPCGSSCGSCYQYLV